MTDTLNAWERQYFVDDGREPLLFYVIFGEIDTSEALSQQKYRSAGIPLGIDAESYCAENHRELLDGFREGYSWNKFLTQAPQHVAQVKNCHWCTVLKGTPTESKTLNYLRDAVGLITYMLDHGGCAVFDPQVLHWWTPVEWRERLFEPAAPVPTHHVVILVSDEAIPNQKWFHTRGMRKFGRPDLSMHYVNQRHEENTIRLFNYLISVQAFGASFIKNQYLTLDLLNLDLSLSYDGNLNNPDFNNSHLEISIFNN